MTEPNPDIILVWPHGRSLNDPVPVQGYSVRALTSEDEDHWVAIHRKAVPSFSEPDLRVWFERYRRLSLPEGILVAEESVRHETVATAGSLAHSKGGLFPEGGQLGWVATVPEHRNRGLGKWLSAIATNRLLREGFRNIYLCTGDDLIPAIRVYLRLGYIPCLYAPDQTDRWQKICARAEVAFEPDRWPDVDRYLAGHVAPRPPDA